MAFYRCGSGGGTVGIPLYVNASGSNNPTITPMTKGTTYNIIAGGDSAYVIINGYIGTFVVTSGTVPKLPTIIYKDGTQSTAQYDTVYHAKDVAALRVYQIPNHIVNYQITFN